VNRDTDRHRLPPSVFSYLIDTCQAHPRRDESVLIDAFFKLNGGPTVEYFGR
jgi:hypothetical protein